MQALISIIVPLYNKEKFIKQTIDSVILQEYVNWELILVDDCSQDASITLIKANYSKYSNVFLVENIVNKGANLCRNQGVSLAKGEFIIFLDADDVLMPHCLSSRVKAMVSNSDLDFCVHTLGVFEKEIGDRNDYWYPKVKNPLESFLAHQLPWQTMQPIWKKRLVEEVNGFDQSFQRLQDVEFHTRILLKEGIKYELFNSQPDCYFRIDEARLNFNSYEFLNRWISSVVLYCNKFEKVQKNKKLVGTIFRAIQQVCYQFKNSRITLEELNEFKLKLKNLRIYKNASVFKKLCLHFAWWYNMKHRQIPGINKVIYNLIIYIA
jgi:glycosyltransferase involved in cell wall biosynthesis